MSRFQHIQTLPCTDTTILSARVLMKADNYYSKLCSPHHWPTVAQLPAYTTLLPELTVLEAPFLPQKRLSLGQLLGVWELLCNEFLENGGGYCPACKETFYTLSHQSLEGDRVVISTELSEINDIETLKAYGYPNLLVNNKLIRIDDVEESDIEKLHSAELIIDRIIVDNPTKLHRVYDSMRTAVNVGKRASVWKIGEQKRYIKIHTSCSKSCEPISLEKQFEALKHADISSLSLLEPLDHINMPAKNIRALKDIFGLQGELISRFNLEHIPLNTPLEVLEGFDRMKAVTLKALREPDTRRGILINPADYQSNSERTKNFLMTLEKIPHTLFFTFGGCSFSSDHCSDSLPKIRLSQKVNLIKTSSFSESIIKADTLKESAKVCGDTLPSWRDSANIAECSGIFHPIRKIYATTIIAKMNGYSAASFSTFKRGLRCEYCKSNNGKLLAAHCKFCRGTGYKEIVSLIQYKGLPIYKVLSLSISEAGSHFKSHKKISRILDPLIRLGLGDITLGTKVEELSFTVRQLIMLVVFIFERESKLGHVFLEPTQMLDPSSSHTIIEMIEEIATDKTPCTIISSDPIICRIQN